MDKQREDFEKHMQQSGFIVGSNDPYPKGLERDYWRVWQAAWTASLASLQPAQEPVYYSITVNGQHCGNFWPLLKDAEAAAKRLNASCPQDRREVVPLYVQSQSLPSAEKDAEDARRYRWLRDYHIGDDPEAINLQSAKKRGLDAAIDAAIAQKENGNV